MERAMPHDDVVAKFRNQIEDFKPFAPLITHLCNPALRERHWDRILNSLDLEWRRSGLNSELPAYSLRSLMDSGAMDKAELISSISSEASGEYALQLTLEKIAKKWETVDFTVILHDTGGRSKKDEQAMSLFGGGAQFFDDAYILGSVEDSTALLEDHRATLQSMLSSRYVGPIHEEVKIWDERLEFLSTLIDEWIAFQKSWLYLENVFSQQDIQV